MDIIELKDPKVDGANCGNCFYSESLSGLNKSICYCSISKNFGKLVGASLVFNCWEKDRKWFKNEFISLLIEYYNYKKLKNQNPIVSVNELEKVANLNSKFNPNLFKKYYVLCRYYKIRIIEITNDKIIVVVPIPNDMFFIEKKKFLSTQKKVSKFERIEKLFKKYKDDIEKKKIIRSFNEIDYLRRVLVDKMSKIVKEETNELIKLANELIN